MQAKKKRNSKKNQKKAPALYLIIRAGVIPGANNPYNNKNACGGMGKS